MSKIVSAVNAMITNHRRISEVRASGSVLFFRYDGKYTWSLCEDSRDDEYILCYYPGDRSILELCNIDGHDWDYVDVVRYSTDELKTREAKESFAEFYRTLKEKVFGVDQVLDDILDDLLEPDYDEDR